MFYQSSGGLKKSGKLQVLEWVDTITLAKHKEVAPYNENWFLHMSCFHSMAPVPLGRGWGWLMTKIWGQGGTVRYGIMPSQAVSAKASGTWPTGSSKPWRGWKWQKRTKMGAENWHFSDRLGQNHWTSSICQEEALEPMMLGYKLPHSLKNITNDKNPCNCNAVEL